MSRSSTTVSSRSKLKIVFLGDQSTGKSSVIDRYINNTFNPSQDATVGVDFLGKNVGHKNRQYRLQLWDTAGQERFRSLVPNYLRDADCAIFVFDLANYQSIVNISKWIQLFEENKKQQSISILCGNKKDLRNKNDRIKIDNIISKYSIPFLQVSALSGQGIEQLFQRVIDELAANTCLNITKKQSQQPFGLTDKPFIIPESIPTSVFQTRNQTLFQAKTKNRCC